MDSQSSQSSDSEFSKKNKRIANFKYPYPPISKKEQKNETITITTNLLNIITLENINLVLADIIIDNKQSINEELKKRIKDELLNQYNSIKKILIYQNLLFAIINTQFTFPSNIIFKYREINEYKINFENIKKFVYKNFNNNSNLSYIVELVFKDILIKNKNIVKLGKKSLLDITSKKNYINNNNYSMYFISSQVTSNGLYMLINYKDKIISKTVYTKILEIKNIYKERQEQKEKIIEYFEQHKNVISTYGNRKVYKISKINFEKTPFNTTINYKNKNDNIITTLTLLDYYNKNYKLEIKDKNQYLIEVQNIKRNKNEENNEKNIIYLIPELVRIVGSDENDIINNNADNKIKYKNSMNPDKRMEKIKEIYSLFNSNLSKDYIDSKYNIKSPKEVNKEWGINLGKFVEFNAKIIKQPKIIFSDINLESNNGRFRLHNPIIKKEITNKNSFYLCFENDKIN